MEKEHFLKTTWSAAGCARSFESVRGRAEKSEGRAPRSGREPSSPDTELVDADGAPAASQRRARPVPKSAAAALCKFEIGEIISF